MKSLFIGIHNCATFLATILLATFVGSLHVQLAAAADEVSIIHGARLYDDWFRESNVQPPVGPHPSFPAKNSGVPANETWRCSTCHGMDYKGSNGMVGIRTRQGADVKAIIALLKNATHKYDALISESDLQDIATFVSSGQMDMAAIVDASRRAKPTAQSFEKVYGTICAGCHDLDGRRMRGIPPLGEAARQRPNEVLHSILFGHPGREMPALLPLGVDVAAKMLAYLQTLPAVNLSVSVAHGGRLYDDWQAEEGARKQALAHPSYPATGYYAKQPQVTWRCRTCHGWDYKGNQGEYATGPSATGIKGIRGMAGGDTAQIMALLRNSTHQYGAVLKERDILDLANFVSSGQIDMDIAIDRTSRRFKGDAGHGSPYFRAICASCHGQDGKRITTTSLGRLVKRNPYGSMHMILNGHPDEKMPALRELDLQLAIDILTYVQDIP